MLRHGAAKVPAAPSGSQVRRGAMRLIPLALAGSLAGCGPGEGLDIITGGSTQPRQPIVSTESLAPRVGCAHVARLLNDRAASVSEVVRRRADCPPDGTPGWISVNDEQAFRNYEDIGYSVRGLQRPRT